MPTKKEFLRRVKCLTRKCYETYCPPLETETHKSVNWLPLSMFIIDERKNTVALRVSLGIFFPVCDASSLRVILAFHYWDPFIYPDGERGFPRIEHDNALINLPLMQTTEPLGSFSNNESDGNENAKRAIGLITKNNSARALHFLVHFFDGTARLGRKIY